MVDALSFSVALSFKCIAIIADNFEVSYLV